MAWATTTSPPTKSPIGARLTTSPWAPTSSSSSTDPPASRLCGYVPTPMDAYLFAQINDGNAVSVPLGEEYTWQGKENLEKTIEKLFSEPFGQGYPKSEAERKKKDTLLLKRIRKNSQVSISEFLSALPKDLAEKIRTKENVIAYIRENGKDPDILAWLR